MPTIMSRDYKMVLFKQVICLNCVCMNEVQLYDLVQPWLLVATVKFGLLLLKCGKCVGSI